MADRCNDDAILMARIARGDEAAFTAIWAQPEAATALPPVANAGRANSGHGAQDQQRLMRHP